MSRTITSIVGFGVALPPKEGIEWHYSDSILDEEKYDLLAIQLFGNGFDNERSFFVYIKGNANRVYTGFSGNGYSEEMKFQEPLNVEIEQLEAWMKEKGIEQTPRWYNVVFHN